MVRKKLQAKYMILETRKDGTKFTNRPLKEAAERLQNLSGQYDDMQKQLVEQVSPPHMVTCVGSSPIAQIGRSVNRNRCVDHVSVCFL